MSFSTAGSVHSLGDIDNTYKKLTRLLQKIHYPYLYARDRAYSGDTLLFLPMLRYVITSMSSKLTRYFLKLGYEIYVQNDTKFMECVYKIVLNVGHYYPVLTVTQFMSSMAGAGGASSSAAGFAASGSSASAASPFSASASASKRGGGFAERKIHLVTNIIQMCLTKHQELVKLDGGSNSAGSIKDGIDGGSEDSKRSESEKKRRRAEAQKRLTTPRPNYALMEDEELAKSSATSSAAPTQRGRRSTGNSTLNSSRSASTSASAASSRPTSRAASRTRSASQRPTSARSGATSTSTGLGPLKSAMKPSSSSSSHHPSANPSIAPSLASSFRRHHDPLASQPHQHQQQDEKEYISDEHIMNASSSSHHTFPPQSHNQQPSSSQITKKAWVHEHHVGSEPVAVMGYVAVDDVTQEGATASGASHILTLREREELEAQQKEAAAAAARQLQEQKARRDEEDRITRLKLSHQDYSWQNSPHFDRAQNGERSFSSQHPASQSYYSQAAALSSSIRSPLRPLPPQNVVGDEAGLNQSFSGRGMMTMRREQQEDEMGPEEEEPRSREYQVSQHDSYQQQRTPQQQQQHHQQQHQSYRHQPSHQHQQSHHLHPPSQHQQHNQHATIPVSPELVHLESRLDEISQRTQHVAQRAAAAGRGGGGGGGSARKANSNQPRFGASHSSSSYAPSHSHTTTTTPTLSSLPPRNTPLESQLYTHLSKLTTQMSSMQQEMRKMEEKMEKMTTSTPSTTMTSAVVAPSVASTNVPEMRYSYYHPPPVSSRMHPPPTGAPSLSSSVSYSSFHPHLRNNQSNPTASHMQDSQQQQQQIDSSLPSSSFQADPSPSSFAQQQHALSGPVALAQETVIPSTDQFIEQLKARVRQTNELLNTARATQKVYERSSMIGVTLQ